MLGEQHRRLALLQHEAVLRAVQRARHVHRHVREHVLVAEAHRRLEVEHLALARHDRRRRTRLRLGGVDVRHRHLQLGEEEHVGVAVHIPVLRELVARAVHAGTLHLGRLRVERERRLAAHHRHGELVVRVERALARAARRREVDRLLAHAVRAVQRQHLRVVRHHAVVRALRRNELHQTVHAQRVLVISVEVLLLELEAQRSLHRHRTVVVDHELAAAVQREHRAVRVAVLVGSHELDLLVLVRQNRHVRNRRRHRVLVVTVHGEGRRRHRLLSALDELEQLQVQHVHEELGVRHQVRVEPVAHRHSLAGVRVVDQHAERVLLVLPLLGSHRRLRRRLAALALLDPSNALRQRVASAHLERVALRLVGNHLVRRHALHQGLEAVHALHVHLHAVIRVHVRTVAHHVLLAELHARVVVLVARGACEGHRLLRHVQRAVVGQLLSAQLREHQRLLQNRLRVRAGLVLRRSEEHRVGDVEGGRELDRARLAHREHVLVQTRHAEHARAEDRSVQVDSGLVADRHRHADLLTHQRHGRRDHQRAVLVRREAVLQRLEVLVQHREHVVIAQVAALHLERLREHAHHHVLRALRRRHRREGHDLQRLRVHVRHVRLLVVREVHAHAVHHVLEAPGEDHQSAVVLQLEHAVLQSALLPARLVHVHEVERLHAHLQTRQRERLVHARNHHVRVAAVHRHALHTHRAHAVLVVHERVERRVAVLREGVAEHQLRRHAREQQLHRHRLVQRVVLQTRRVLVEVRLVAAAHHVLHAVAHAHRRAAEAQLLLHKRERQVRVLVRLDVHLRNHQRAHRGEAREARHGAEVVAQVPSRDRARLEQELVELALDRHRAVRTQRVGTHHVLRNEGEQVRAHVRRLHREVEERHGAVER